MNKEIIDAAVGMFSQKAGEIYGSILDSVILYGSCARGDYDDESDIDIMVLLDAPPESIPFERLKMDGVANDISWDLDTLISATYQSREVFDRFLPVSGFYKNVSREGIRVG